MISYFRNFLSRFRSQPSESIIDETPLEQRIADFIKPFEGLRLTAYKCPAGVWTIGYGTTRGVYKGMKITKLEANALLLQDIKEVVNSLHRLCKVALNENEIIALCDFIYNLGSGSFQRSTLRQKLNRGEKRRAASELLKWNKARVNGVLKPLAGLTRRRKAEKEVFLT